MKRLVAFGTKPQWTAQQDSARAFREPARDPAAELGGSRPDCRTDCEVSATGGQAVIADHHAVVASFSACYQRSKRGRSLERARLISGDRWYYLQRTLQFRTHQVARQSLLVYHTRKLMEEKRE